MKVKFETGDDSLRVRTGSSIARNLQKGDLHYIHNQLQPSDEWAIHHNLGKRASVTIVDSANNVVIGEVQYVDADNCIVRFQAAFAGRAYLN